MSKVSCETCPSGNGGFFCAVKEPQLSFVDEKKSHKSYKKGHVLFERGSTPEGVYCVIKGITKIETENEEGKTHILRLVGPGNLVGYRALFGKKKYEARAVVHEDSEICFIPKDVIFEIVEKDPQYTLKFLEMLSEDIKQAESRLCSATDKATPARVAETILFLHTHYDPIKPWTRKDIADWAGTTPETVMRQISAFEDEGVLGSEGRKVVILNKDRLKDLAEAAE